MDAKMIYLLVAQDYDHASPIGAYSDMAEAEEEGRRLEGEYKRTSPAHSAWCSDRWRIVERWRNEGREMTQFGLPTDEGEAEIVSLIGPCPQLIGREFCDVWEVENRLRAIASRLSGGR